MVDAILYTPACHTGIVVKGLKAYFYKKRKTKQKSIQVFHTGVYSANTNEKYTKPPGSLVSSTSALFGLPDHLLFKLFLSLVGRTLLLGPIWPLYRVLPAPPICTNQRLTNSLQQITGLHIFLSLPASRSCLAFSCPWAQNSPHMSSSLQQG